MVRKRRKRRPPAPGRESWREYERGVLEALRYEFEPVGMRIEGTIGAIQHRLRGRHSGALRQLDAAVYGPDQQFPFLVADAKFRSEPLDLNDVDQFIGMMDDVGATMGMLVAAAGRSAAAERRAAAANVVVRIMSIDEALVARWLPTAREIYRYDWSFHVHIAHAVRALVGRADPSQIEVLLEEVPFEEWEALLLYALRHHRRDALLVLNWIARTHRDDAWVFNAARILSEHQEMTSDLLAHLRTRDNPDLHELLDEEDGGHLQGAV